MHVRAWLRCLRSRHDKRSALVTIVRAHRLRDDVRRPDGVVHRDASSVIFRYGLGAQVAF